MSTPPARFGDRARGCLLAASAFWVSPLIRANIYIDGLNLYYRALRGTPHRWLDPRRLARLLLPEHRIGRIRYFTALVANRPDDPTQAQRQQAYLRALATVPDLTIHYGHLMAKTKRRPLARLPESGPRTVEILDTEEKGSDVNLASYLLLDGFEDEYELAVVVSNDSDLMLPIRMVKERLGKQVGVFDPSRRRSFELHGAASWYRPLRQGPLSASLFPDTLSDSQGTVSKPASW
ncbi:MAG: NYN domain-containing protein [Chloroflexi bacterium]|nr:NYN domain-containing protein [Chloroflexota bacterium]